VELTRRFAFIGAAVILTSISQATLCRAQSVTRPTSPAANLQTTVQFGFDIIDLLTNHQFPGQRNSFYVSYEYTAVLEGGSFDPAGHVVSSGTFPYFQNIRNDMISYINNYPSSSDFYELFANNIARHVMINYPQLKWIEMTVLVPGFGQTNIDRWTKIRVNRGE
jgi:hypothetical protein